MRTRLFAISCGYLNFALLDQQPYIYLYIYIYIHTYICIYIYVFIMMVYNFLHRCIEHFSCVSPRLSCWGGHVDILSSHTVSEFAEMLQNLWSSQYTLVMAMQYVLFESLYLHIAASLYRVFSCTCISMAGLPVILMICILQAVHYLWHRALPDQSGYRVFDCLYAHGWAASHFDDLHLIGSSLLMALRTPGSERIQNIFCMCISKAAGLRVILMICIMTMRNGNAALFC